MHLTFTEQIVIRYFEKNPNKILVATIRQLAKLTCTSTGSIERAVKKLGYENFSHYRYTQKAIQIAENRFKSDFNVTKSVEIRHSIRQINLRSVSISICFRFTGRDYAARTKGFFYALSRETSGYRLGFASKKEYIYLSPV